jgi:hypothetical protein
VYSHIVFGNVQQTPDIPAEVLINRTQSTYKGPLLVGQDLMSFIIGKDVIALGPNGELIKPSIVEK